MCPLQDFAPPKRKVYIPACLPWLQPIRFTFSLQNLDRYIIRDQIFLCTYTRAIFLVKLSLWWSPAFHCFFPRNLLWVLSLIYSVHSKRIILFMYVWAKRNEYLFCKWECKHFVKFYWFWNTEIKTELNWSSIAWQYASNIYNSTWTPPRFVLEQMLIFL